MKPGDSAADGLQTAAPLDPYACLELLPGVPHDLVVEAYWLVASRADSEAAIDRLNAAYALLSQPELRATYDREHGLTGVPDGTWRKIRRKRPGIWRPGRQTRFTSDYEDHYELLGVDKTADPRLIDTAYRVMCQVASGPGEKSAFARQLLTEAHSVLMDQHLRAQYDADRAAGASKHGRVPAPSNENLAHDTHNNPHDEPPTTPAADEELTPEPTSVAETAFAKGAKATSRSPRVLIGTARGAASALAHLIAALLLASRWVLNRVWAASHGSFNRLRSGARPARPEAPPAPLSPYDHAALRASVEDVNDRLLGLRSGAPPPHKMEPAPLRHVLRDNEHGVAELAFFEGPLAGTRITLGEWAVTMGTGEDCDINLEVQNDATSALEARISPYGSGFLFRQVAGNGTLVGGLPLTLPAVMLEDGDEIRIGVHSMRFVDHHAAAATLGLRDAGVAQRELDPQT